MLAGMWCSDKESSCQARRHRFNHWVGKIPWSSKWQPTPIFLPGEFHGQSGLVGYSSWGCKELDTTQWLTHTHTGSMWDLTSLTKDWTCAPCSGSSFHRTTKECPSLRVWKGKLELDALSPGWNGSKERVRAIKYNFSHWTDSVFLLNFFLSFFWEEGASLVTLGHLTNPGPLQRKCGIWTSDL